MGCLKCNVFSVEIALCLALIFLSVYVPIQGNKRAFAQTFSDPINLSNITHGAECQDIKVSGNNVYVAWSDSKIGDGNILFRKSSDSGLTFGVTRDLSEGDQAACPQIAVSGNNVYIVWNEVASTGSTDVFFRRSTDAGDNFDSIKNLSHNSRSSCCPFVATSGKLVHVVWDDDTPPGSSDFFTLYSRSSNSGTSFSDPKNLIKPPINEALDAKVAASGDYVFVVWNGDTPDGLDVYMRISKDGGNNFGSTKNLSNDGADSGGAVLRVSGNKVYVAWESDESGNREIFFKRSTNLGASFGKTLNLSDDPSQSFDPIISSSGDTVYVVWTAEAEHGGADILFKRSTNAAASFSHVRNLTKNLLSGQPSLSKDGSNVQVAWEDTSKGNSEIFLKKSTNLGLDFAPRIDVSNTPETSVSPKAVSSDGLVYVTWLERSSDSDSDLLFVRSTDTSSNVFQEVPHQTTMMVLPD